MSIALHSLGRYAPAVLLAGAVAAMPTPASLFVVPSARDAGLSWVIADQGNRALQDIRAESRAAIAAWPLPALPRADVAAR
jgi:hypothetical protein